MHLTWQLNQTLITDPNVYTYKTLPKNISTKSKKGYDQAEKNDKTTVSTMVALQLGPTRPSVGDLKGR